jgi:cytochrome c oxidase subunit I
MATATAGRFTRIWETHPRSIGWLVTVDHKKIGVRYICTAYIVFLLSGIGALLLRIQLARPENTFLTPTAYNQIFTLHGTTMIFLFATPILFGFGNYLIPLMIGARDMAFPRLNAFGYWVFLLAGIFIFSSVFIHAVPNAGWFNYVPLSGPTYSPDLNIDFYALGLMFLGISTMAGAINFIVSIFKARAPGMSINRMPLFVWTILVTSFAVLFALPALTAACGLLELERKFGFHFFDAAGGGNALLWQHLFWFFGHPDVYIIFLPAVGMVSMIIETFARTPVVGYTALVLASVATGIIAFGVWVHHMFAVGLPQLSTAFFAAASTVIAIPAGVQIFAWIATLWRGKPLIKTPLLFIIGFFVTFIIGGLTGVMFASVPFDRATTDTYFVVAHFHYVLIGGFVFPLFGAFYYWLPKITGRMLNEGLGQLSFWLIFVGMQVTFFTMHITGILGMPRRVYTYQGGLGWDAVNLISTIGAFIIAAGAIVFVLDVVRSLTVGEPAGDNPWGAGTLEWATSSPPPEYNFRTLPVVRSRNPLWEREEREGGARDPQEGTEMAESPALTERTDAAYTRDVRAEARNLRRETMGTSLLDADPERVLAVPRDSPWPLILAIGVGLIFLGILTDQIVTAVIGVVVGLVAATGWFWPTAMPEGEEGAA